MATTGRHSPGLDFVRAAAIVWVTLYHAMTFGFVPDGASAVVDFGWMGVDLFFVLSGFLIAGPFFDAVAAGRKPDYARFVRHRALRTLPAYAAVVGLYFLAPALRERPDIQPFWQFATFTENLAIDLNTPKSFSHVWSLCVEEQFYLLFPLVAAWLVGKPSFRKGATVVAALVVAGVALRGILWLWKVADVPFDTAATPDARRYMTAIYYPTWCRLDGLLAGVAAAAVRSFRPHWWRRAVARPNALLAIGLAGLVASIRFFGDQIATLLPAMLGFPLLAASCATIVAAASDRRCVLERPIPGVAMLAAGAYSLYLGQKIAFHLVSTALLPPSLSVGARLAGALAAVGALGAAIYWIVERPGLRWRDRLDRATREKHRVSSAAEERRGAQAPTSSSTIIG